MESCAIVRLARSQCRERVASSIIASIARHPSLPPKARAIEDEESRLNKSAPFLSFFFFFFFFADHFRIDFYQKYMCIYICISVYVRLPSSLPPPFFSSGGGVDRPPNARVLCTDIRTIKELLMVRIWSRWAADIHRRSQPVPIFYPTPLPTPNPNPLGLVVDDRAGLYYRSLSLSLSLLLSLSPLATRVIRASRSPAYLALPPRHSLIHRRSSSRRRRRDFRMVDQSQSDQSVTT